MFTLILVESNLNTTERDALFERLRQDLCQDGLELKEVKLTYESWDATRALARTLGSSTGENTVLLLQGLERTPPGPILEEGSSRPPAFAGLNQARELLEDRYRVPLIVWCEPYTYSALQRHAPDFFDHFTGIVRFVTDREGFQGRKTETLDLARAEIDPPKEGPGASAAAVRFYEKRLEKLEPGSEEHVRALLGLAEALVDRRDVEGIGALERAADAAKSAKEQLSPTEELDEWARANFLVARSLGELGQLEEAMPASQEAVRAYERLAEVRPEAFLLDLAGNLNNLGNLNVELGQPEDALQATQRAVDIYEELAKKRPDAFLLDLAMSLNNLGILHAELGRHDDALQATLRAVDIRETLAEKQPDAFLPGLALSLNNLSIRHAELGHLEDALQAAQRAVDIRETLAEKLPDAFLPGLAASLNNLGLRHAEMGRHDDALQAALRAVDIYETLAEKRPDAFLPDLARSLNNLGIRHAELGRHDDALQATLRAVDIYETLAEKRPDAFLPHLAVSLSNLGARYTELGRPEEALEAAEEAVEKLLPFFELRPRAHAAWMRGFVGNYLNWCENSGVEPKSEWVERIEKVFAELEAEETTEH